MNRSFCLRAEVNYIFLFAELYIKKHKKLNIKLTNQVKIKNIQRMLFELGKKGFKSETICCEWENVEQSPTPNCHKKKVIDAIFFNNNIFYLNTVGFKAKR